VGAANMTKPCPVCGGSETQIESDLKSCGELSPKNWDANLVWKSHRVCPCGVSGPYADDKPEADAAWNAMPRKEEP